jgi:hypothetical protein
MLGYHGTDSTDPAILDLVSVVYYTMRNLWLERLDTQKFWYGCQLFAAGYH